MEDIFKRKTGSDVMLTVRELICRGCGTSTSVPMLRATLTNQYILEGSSFQRVVTVVTPIVCRWCKEPHKHILVPSDRFPYPVLDDSVVILAMEWGETGLVI